MRTLARAVSYPAEVVLSEDGGLYHFTAAYEDVILSDTSHSVMEAVEEVIRFLVVRASYRGHSFGVVRDVAETLAVAVASVTGQNAKAVYRKLVSL